MVVDVCVVVSKCDVGVGYFDYVGCDDGCSGIVGNGCWFVWIVVFVDVGGVIVSDVGEWCCVGDDG